MNCLEGLSILTSNKTGKNVEDFDGMLDGILQNTSHLVSAEVGEQIKQICKNEDSVRGAYLKVILYFFNGIRNSIPHDSGTFFSVNQFNSIKTGIEIAISIAIPCLLPGVGIGMHHLCPSAAKLSAEELTDLQMTKDQVRWKMNALIKKYKEYIDNASKSGRGAIDFEWLDQMEEIFGYQRNAEAGYTISSSILSKKKKSLPAGEVITANRISVTHQSNVKKSADRPSSKSTTDMKSSSSTNHDSGSSARKDDSGSSSAARSNVLQKRVRPQNGTGSKIAKAELELEKQWVEHLQNKENREAIRDERNVKLLEKKQETMQIKKKQLAMREKELQLKIKLSENRSKEKAQKHSEMMEIERMKYKLLRKLIKNKSSGMVDKSDSDN